MDESKDFLVAKTMRDVMDIFKGYVVTQKMSSKDVFCMMVNGEI